MRLVAIISRAGLTRPLFWTQFVMFVAICPIYKFFTPVKASPAVGEVQQNLTFWSYTSEGSFHCLSTWNRIFVSKVISKRPETFSSNSGQLEKIQSLFLLKSFMRCQAWEFNLGLLVAKWVLLQPIFSYRSTVCDEQWFEIVGHFFKTI